MSVGMDAKSEHKLDGGNVYGISNKQYTINLILLVILFSSYSFSFWLIDFQQEYLGTDMFILFYANGIVCIISGQLNLVLYPRLGLKTLVIWMNSIGIVATSFIIMIQQKVIAYSDKDEEFLFVSIAVPSFLVVLSLCIQVGFTAIFQVAFEDDRIFPFKRRATSCNIIIMVSKALSIGAPFVNEEEEPIPLLVVLGVQFVIFVVIFFFPSKAKLDQMQKV